MQKEIWKDIPEYEGLYQASNWGRIKSLPRKTKNRFQTGMIKKQTLRTGGYFYINLCDKNHNNKLYTVHRIVALTFIPNPNNYPCINHKDGNKQNNYVENLEWCTYSHNEKHAYRNNLKKPNSIKINQYNLKGEYIKTWNSIKEANTFYKTSHIGECCNNNSKRNIAKGFLWEYAN